MTLQTIIIAASAMLATPDDLPATLRPDYIQMADSADWYIAREMWPDAKRCTIEALRRDPSNFNNAMLFSNLGIINLNLGLYDEAISNFDLGLSIAPASTTLKANRARAYLNSGKYAEASADLKELTDNNPADDWAWKMYGVTLMALGRPDEGVQALKHIESPDADTLHMIAQAAMQKGDTETARIYFDRMLEASPSEDSWVTHATFLIMTGDTSAASDDIRQGLKQYPRSGTLVLLRAYIHQIMHENALAEMDVHLAREYGVDEQLVNSLFPPKKKKK